jgi:hypothetical protein
MGYTRHNTKIEENEMNDACSTYARDRKCMQNFNREHEGKRSFGRPRCTWVGNIKIEHQEIGLRVWTVHLAQNRDPWRALVNTAVNFGLLKGRSSINDREFDYLSGY